MNGSLALTVERRCERTALASVRYDGMARCSRAFTHGLAARVVTSLLGPGYVAGDRVELHGSVGAHAHLVVADQSATRVFGGRATSSSRSVWRVASGATLALLREPTTLFAGSRHETQTTIDLPASARAIVVDLVTAAEPDFVSYATNLEIRCDGALVAVDRACLGAASFPARAVGSLVVVGGIRASAVAAIEDLLDAACDVRAGLGRPLGEGLVVRVYGDDMWHVRETLYACATLARDQSPRNALSFAFTNAASVGLVPGPLANA